MTGPGRVVDDYLAEVAARLHGPGRVRRGILAELRAGLMDAADSRVAAGLAPGDAVRAAVAEFGEPGRVAGGFRAELAAARARRTALTLVTAGPLIGGLWVVAALACGVGARFVPPWRWAGVPAGARPVIEVAVVALVLAIGGTLVTLAVTGRLGARFPTRPLLTAAVAAGGTAPIDLTLLTLLAVAAAYTPGRLAVLPVTAAAAASLGRLGFAARATWVCLASR